MMIPSVHMNGTSRADLRKQALDVYEACDVLIEALRNAMPNGRDYYPQGPGAINDAISEHQRRFADVRAIKEAMEQRIIAMDEGRVT